MKLPVKYSKHTPQERRKIRLEYVRIQKGKCWYCDGHLEQLPPLAIRNKKITRGLFPKGFFDNPVHLQHDHNTDLTEGAVHSWCNAVLYEYHGR